MIMERDNKSVMSANNVEWAATHMLLHLIGYASTIKATFIA